MIQIKFQFLYKGMPYSAENQDRPWFKKVYSLDELLATPIDKLSDVHGFSELVAKRQFTGITDNEFNDIFHGDIVIDHVGIGVVVWCDKNCSFKVSYRGENEGQGKWFRDYTDNELGTIEVIGNIHQNPELLA